MIYKQNIIEDKNCKFQLQVSNNTACMVFLDTFSTWESSLSYWFLIILFWACYILTAFSKSAILISRFWPTILSPLWSSYFFNLSIYTFTELWDWMYFMYFLLIYTPDYLSMVLLYSRADFEWFS